jgi:predicted ATPase
MMPSSRRSLPPIQQSVGGVPLTLTAKDFGPINHCEITLRPLTLFIGPNNSGKSYLATLIHSLFEAIAPTAAQNNPRGGFFPSVNFNIRALLNKFPDQRKLLGELETKQEIELSPELVDSILSELFATIYEKRLTDELMRSFACRLRDLVKIGTSAFSLGIRFASYEATVAPKGSRLRTTEYSRQGVRVRVRYAPSADARHIDVHRDADANLLTVSLGRGWFERGGGPKGAQPFFVLDLVADFLALEILRPVTRPCYYLPAARSGILQAHKALAASIVRKSPYAGIEALEIPKMSGVVSDFISSVITLPNERGPFYTLALQLEKDLIRGQILARTSEKQAYPEITYRFRNTEIPLSRSSSTVSELAPLLLYLKYGISPRGVLIIEEPEAHLHPENQRVLARYLVRLIRRNVTILLTTHSEYLLNQLNAFLLLSKLAPEKRQQVAPYESEDFVRTDELAVYVFKNDQTTGGSAVTEVKVSEDDGIPDQEFLRIHEALYSEAVKLRRELGEE